MEIGQKTFAFGGKNEGKIELKRQILHFGLGQNTEKQLNFLAAPIWQDVKKGLFNMGNRCTCTWGQILKK